MNDVQFIVDDNGNGTFAISSEGRQSGEMKVGISGNNLTAYHTEVDPQDEGKGLAKEMLNAMVNYARSNKLKVIPLCQFVHAQFKRHPGEYADIWEKEQRS